MSNFGDAFYARAGAWGCLLHVLHETLAALAGLEQVAECGGEGLARGEAGAAGGVLAGTADGDAGAEEGA